ncbi:MAG: large subunit ribosomal protein [Clostridia bacterium]|nr:large subunit ribosomal protein [Clostridia bacterium]
MKVILTQDVPKLGNRGAVVEVAEGHARNYLIPKGLAIEATKGRIKELNQQKKRQEQKQQKELEMAKRQAELLEGKTIKIITRAGKAGKLFGSVTNKEIAKEIKNTFHIEVDRRKIEVKDPIKALGSYEVMVKLHPTVQVCLVVQVVAEGS